MERLPLTAFPEKLHKHVDAKAPVPLRMMAAKGLVPMGPAELWPVLFQLSLDADPGVAEAARKTAHESPADLRRTGATADVPGPVLDFLAGVVEKSDELLLAVLANKNTPDETFVRVARHCSEPVTEGIADNQVRLLRTPAIIESLYLNEKSRMSTIDKIVDLARRNKVSFTGLPTLKMLVEDARALQEPAPQLPDGPEAAQKAPPARTPPQQNAAPVPFAATAAVEGPAGDDAFSRLLREALSNEASLSASEAGMSEDELGEKRMKEQEEGASYGAALSAAQIDALSVSQKVRLATLGSKKERDYLIRNGNRLVYMAAVMSPKVQIQDIVGWSANKSISDGVIAYLANKREYRRKYTVVRNLAFNPKTPFREAVSLLNLLHEADVKNLARSRGVPPQLQRMAKQLMETREKGRRG